jgi:hypothetical protein
MLGACLLPMMPRAIELALRFVGKMTNTKQPFESTHQLEVNRRMFGWEWKKEGGRT